jgi:methylthioribose-1-phosphate isomerase
MSRHCGRGSRPTTRWRNEYRRKTLPSIWPHADGASVEVIDQTLLPHEFVIKRLGNLSEAAEAIRSMVIRGAPLVGVTAAYGLAIAMRSDASDEGIADARQALLATRSTAVNLRWALDEMRATVAPLSPSARPDAAWTRAGEIADEDVAFSRRIGLAGMPLMELALASALPTATAAPPRQIFNRISVHHPQTGAVKAASSSTYSRQKAWLSFR